MSHAERPEPGDRIDGYELLEFLGAGGMGRVFRARRGERELALKLMLSRDAESCARLAREAEAAGRLPPHPGLVRIHGARIDGAQPYLAFELVKGETLKQRLARSGSLELAEAVELVLRLTEACAVAHRHGVTHRDIKPGNVMIDDDGAPRLLDLGLARVADLSPLTRSGMQLGTPGWMAPEQIEARAEDIGPATDTRALVLILVTVISGRNPYLGATELETSRRILRGPEPALDACRDHPALGPLIQRGMALSPSERFADAEALAIALGELPGPLARDKTWRDFRPGARSLALAAVIAGVLVFGAIARDTLHRQRREAALATLTDEAFSLRRSLALRKHERRLRRCLLADFSQACPDLLPDLGALPELPEARRLEELSRRLKALDVARENPRRGRLDEALGEARALAAALAPAPSPRPASPLSAKARRVNLIRAALANGTVPPERKAGEDRLPLATEELVDAFRFTLLRRFEDAVEALDAALEAGSGDSREVLERLRGRLTTLVWIERQALRDPQLPVPPRPSAASLMLLKDPGNTGLRRRFQREARARLDNPAVTPAQALRLFWNLDALLAEIPDLTAPTLSGPRHFAMAEVLGQRIAREHGERHRGQYRFHRARWFQRTPDARLDLEDLSLTSLSLIHTLSGERTARLDALYEQCLQAARGGLLLFHVDSLTGLFATTGLVREGLARYPGELAPKLWLALTHHSAVSRTAPNKSTPAELRLPRIRAACREILENPSAPRAFRGACAFQLAELAWKTGPSPDSEGLTELLELCSRALELGATDPLPIHRLRCDMLRTRRPAQLEEALDARVRAIKESAELQNSGAFSTGRFRAAPRMPLTRESAQIELARVEVDRATLALLNNSPAEARRHIRRARALSNDWDTTHELCRRLALHAGRELLESVRAELRPEVVGERGKKCLEVLSRAIRARHSAEPDRHSEEPPAAPRREPSTGGSGKER